MARSEANRKAWRNSADFRDALNEADGVEEVEAMGGPTGTQSAAIQQELKRGQEYLEKVRSEIKMLRARLEDWPAYEQVCGKNPVEEFLQTLETRQKTEEFLLRWLARREKQVQLWPGAGVEASSAVQAKAA